VRSFAEGQQLEVLELASNVELFRAPPDEAAISSSTSSSNLKNEIGEERAIVVFVCASLSSDRVATVTDPNTVKTDGRHRSVTTYARARVLFRQMRRECESSAVHDMVKAATHTRGDTIIIAKPPQGHVHVLKK
jgi:hypothetical protein